MIAALIVLTALVALADIGRSMRAENRAEAIRAELVEAAPAPITEPAELDPWPLDPIHTCEPPPGYVPWWARPDDAEDYAWAREQLAQIVEAAANDPDDVHLAASLRAAAYTAELVEVA